MLNTITPTQTDETIRICSVEGIRIPKHVTADQAFEVFDRAAKKALNGCCEECRQYFQYHCYQMSRKMPSAEQVAYWLNHQIPE